MKVTAILALASITVAAPSITPSKRQLGFPVTYNDLVNGTGGCKQNTLIWARGSTEPGNVGNFGSLFVPGLKAVLPEIAVQGVNFPPGSDGLMTSIKCKGATNAAIAEVTKMINLAVSKCPNTAILTAGWSLGTAALNNTIQELPKNIQDRIAGTIFFGSYLYDKNNPYIPNFPHEKVKVFCDKKDAACSSFTTPDTTSLSPEEACKRTVTISSGHISYSISPGDSIFREGVTWGVGKLQSLGSKSSTSTPASS